MNIKTECVKSERTMNRRIENRMEPDKRFVNQNERRAFTVFADATVECKFTHVLSIDDKIEIARENRKKKWNRSTQWDCIAYIRLQTNERETK